MMIQSSALFLPWRLTPLQQKCLTRQTRKQTPRIGRAATGDDVPFSVVERSVDFSEVEYIEVDDPHSGATFRAASEIGAADVKGLGFSTAEEATEIPADTTTPTAANALWILGLCTISYLHCSSTGFAIPALLPSIAADSALTDSQGAFLTVGFTMVYALMQIPFGFLADRMNRPQLLSFGIVCWSVVTALASKATSFSDLLLVRLSTAASQSMQNPVAYGLIPELFPNKGTTAMSLYNSALYIGRALSFFLALILVKFGVHEMMGIHTVPLDQFDVTSMSLLYVTGDQATVAPLFDYDFIGMAQSASSWRDLLFWVGIPGLGIGFLMALVQDPREQNRSLPAERPKQGIQEMRSKIESILQNKSFRATTLAASLNDIGFWSLISWQAIFYERVYGISSSVYAPLLAAIIPISGIVGGVGGSLLSDWLSQRNARFILTSGGTLLGSPLIFMSFQAADYPSSFLYLLFGYLFLESWRASCAIMVRESCPADAVSTAAAIHLSLRNLLASVGPILIAALEPKIGLRDAMCIIPLSYMASAICFGIAEKRIIDEKSRRTSIS